MIWSNLKDSCNTTFTLLLLKKETLMLVVIHYWIKSQNNYEVPWLITNTSPQVTLVRLITLVH